MTSNIVKCSNCDVVINELLTFVRNVMDYMDEESIHQLCTTSFSIDDIAKAKSLLFESMPNAKKMPLRRKKDKKRMSRDLDDIINLMKSADPQIFPIFVARDLHLVPPVTFDHVDVTRLLKDILCLKSQLNALEEKVITSDQFNLLKQEIEHIKHASLIDDFSPRDNVNKGRGACLQNSFMMSSGPIGLPYVPEYVPIKASQTSAVAGIINQPSLVRHSSSKELDADDSVSFTYAQNKATEDANRTEALAHTAVTSMSNIGDSRAVPVCSDSISTSETENRDVRVGAPAAATVSTEPVASGYGTSASDGHGLTTGNRSTEVVIERALISSATRIDARGGLSARDPSVKYDQVVGDSEWQIVQKKSAKRYKLIGQRGSAPTAPDGKFKAADVKVPLLISNVSKDASVSDIISYIQDKTDESVSLKKINMRKTKPYNSYKLYVSKCKVDLFLKDNFWPSGVTFRRFVNFLYKKGSVVKDSQHLVK
ncbi:uncharacterized protein LOC114355939 [Ostrinia furnacalis]|uniref:uncharacterized protein LOC114355939 n=1 Tax=Ostrinia furnacalis TaxID=93504 RepID=UPI0010393A8A|nr:uncharacterized protein LOC114355939 [Ostrinia furnacalis]